MKIILSLLILCFLLNTIVESFLQINYIDSVRKDYELYFNTTLDASKRANRIFINEKSGIEDKFLIEYKLDNQSILDLRLYYYSQPKLTYKSTDQGVFFPKKSIKDILRFLYSNTYDEIIPTDIGFLYFDYIVINNEVYLYIKMLQRVYDVAKFRGILLNSVEVQVFTAALNAFDWEQ